MPPKSCDLGREKEKERGRMEKDKRLQGGRN